MDMVFHIPDDILVFTLGGLYRRGDENEIIEQFFAALWTHNIRKILADCRGSLGACRSRMPFSWHRTYHRIIT